MTACPPDQRRPLRRVSDEEVSLAQHVGHDTAVDDRLSWRAAGLGAAVERPCTQKRYVNADTVNCFKSRLDKFWANQKLMYNFRSEIHGTGSRSEVVLY